MSETMRRGSDILFYEGMAPLTRSIVPSPRGQASLAAIVLISVKSNTGRVIGWHAPGNVQVNPSRLVRRRPTAFFRTFSVQNKNGLHQTDV